MKSLVLALALVALTGCGSTRRFCDQHPVACPMIVTALGTSLLMCIPESGHSRVIGTQPAPEIPTPSVTCTSAGNCK